MRVLYVGSFRKVWDEEGVARGLEANGVEVVRMEEAGFDFKEYKKAIDEKPGALLFAKLKVLSSNRSQIVQYAKDKKVWTACLVPDLYFGLSREYKVQSDPIFKADVVMTPDGGERDWGTVQHRVLRQAIPDEFCYIGKPDEERGNDIIFVGCFNPEYPYRAEMLMLLKERYGSRFTWYGKGDSDEVRGHDLNTLYASSKIVIGDSVWSPNYWSNRIYETLGRGGFLIHPCNPGLEREYTPYKHYIPYKPGDFQGLFRIIDHYLEDERHRKEIQLAARWETKLRHTQSVRCKDLVHYLTR